MSDPADYPELRPFLADDIDDIMVKTMTNDGGTYFLVTASAGDSSDQFLFVKTDTGIVDITDQAGAILGTAQKGGFQGAASPTTHAQALVAAKAAVNKFDTSSGPGSGSLACCWSLRTILHNTLGYWVTHTDGTDTFGDELKAAYHQSSTEDQVLPGGIIISPSITLPRSKKRIVGHVGILGEGPGDDRLVYSNSSRKKLWSQSGTVKSWRDYQAPRGLAVLFYSLPQY